MTRAFLLPALAIGLLAPAGAAGAATVQGPLTGIAVPSLGQGAAAVRAIDPGTTRVLAAQRVSGPGAGYQLTVPAGIVAVAGDVFDLGGGGGQALTPFALIADGSPTALALSPGTRAPATAPAAPASAEQAAATPQAGEPQAPAGAAVLAPVKPKPKRKVKAKHKTTKHKRKSARHRPKPKRKPAARARAAAAGAPVVAVKAFTGTGPYASIANGLASVVEQPIVNEGDERCGVKAIEWRRRADLQAEFDLYAAHPDLFDPATLPHKAWIDPTVFVEGSVATSADGTIAWDIKMVDATTGAIVGGDKGNVVAQNGDGGAWLDGIEAIGRRLIDQLCATGYTVKLDAHALGTYGSHDAEGDVHSTVVATPAGLGHWHAESPIAFENLSLVSKMPAPSYESGPTGEPGAWTVDIHLTADGKLDVTFNALLSNRYIVNIPDHPPIGGQPGLVVANLSPQHFELLPGGGNQPVANELMSEAGGWRTTGTVEVTPAS